MSCGDLESTSIVSLLLGLLWYIGGAPPVLRGSTVHRANSLRTLKQTVNFLSKTLTLIIFVMLVTDNVDGAKLSPVESPEHSWCGRTLEEQVEGADIVARASVVSRSRVDKGHYYATFRIDKLLHSTDTDLMAKFLRLKLETKSHRRKTSASLCNFSAKVKPNNKYLVMVKKQGVKKAGIFANADHYSLYSPPLKSTRKLMKEVKSILCPNCREVHDLRQRVRVRRGRGGHQTSTNRSARDQIEGTQKENEDVTTALREDAESAKENKIHPTEQIQRKKKNGNKGNTRLSCSARGNPPPTLYWTMDGKVIENSPSTRIITKNLSKFLRKSILKLKHSVSNRSVHLQCHAFNSYGHTSKVKMTKPARINTSKATEVMNKRKSSSRLNGFRKSPSGLKSGSMLGKRNNGMGDLMRSETYTAGLAAGHMRSPLYSTGCPIPDYCMNGGTCQFYSTIGEQTCHCARGYHGRRCERKYVSTGNFGAKMSDKFPMCLLGMAHYPCQ